MIYEPYELCFVIGSNIQGAITEVWLMQKDLVEAHDPAGLNPVDSSSTLGLPAKLVRTPPGQPGMTAYMGEPEQARKDLEAAGITEAPIAWSTDTDTMIYVTKESEFDTDIAPKARVLHTAETMNMAGKPMTVIRLFHRFPGEADWPATMESLPENVSCSIDKLDSDGRFFTLHPKTLVSTWLGKANVAEDIA